MFGFGVFNSGTPWLIIAAQILRFAQDDKAGFIYSSTPCLISSVARLAGDSSV